MDESAAYDVDAAIERAHTGDADSFAIVIEAAHVGIRAYIASVVQDQTVADDLAQETFVFAFQNLAGYQANTNWRAWLRAIARNHVLGHLKRHARTRGHLHEYARFRVAQRLAAEPTDEGAARLSAPSACVQGLPEEQRELLAFAHHREETIEQTAARLCLSAATLRKRISRLYEVLPTCIKRRAALDGGDRG